MIKRIVYAIPGVDAYRRHRRLKALTQLVTFGENTEFKGAVEKRAPNGKIIVGANSLIEGFLVTETDRSELRIGNNVFIGGGTNVDCVTSIVIEDDVLVSYHCTIADSDNASLNYHVRKKHLSEWREQRFDWSVIAAAPIKISKGAWIGARAVILKGIVIGEGAIVGAGSVVSQDVPAWTIVGGNPARVIRELTDEERKAV